MQGIVGTPGGLPDATQPRGDDTRGDETRGDEIRLVKDVVAFHHWDCRIHTPNASEWDHNFDALRSASTQSLRIMEKHNPVIWFEIYVDDLDRAQRFYEQVFDVKLEAFPTPATVESDLTMERFRRK